MRVSSKTTVFKQNSLRLFENVNTSLVDHELTVINTFIDL